MDILDADLRKALQLTTEDLRFIDYIIKQVTVDNAGGGGGGQAMDIFLDGVGWEGGDEWIRAQFRMYTLCLLRTVLNSGADQQYELNRFNAHFVHMWKQTMNYKLWREHVSNEASDLETFVNLPPLHPCSGPSQLSINDMRLHLSNTIHNTESGKKVTQAVANTGRVVAGGLSTAKGVFSSWMTSLKSNQVAKEDKDQDINDDDATTKEDNENVMD